MVKRTYRWRFNLAYIIGGILAVAIVLVLMSPISDSFIAAGPMLIGHETLKCQECHQDERGTLRQQIQANVQYLLGNRQNAVSAGYRTVINKDCIQCHRRPNDRHPVYRFLEPKYSEVRQLVGAHQCVSCHREHQANRVSIDVEFCQHCHDDIALKNDPVDVSHQKLAADKRWDTCLGCHDFHGNHEMKIPQRLSERIQLEKIGEYFLRAKPPYPGKIIHKALSPDYEK